MWQCISKGWIFLQVPVNVLVSLHLHSSPCLSLVHLNCLVQCLLSCCCFQYFILLSVISLLRSVFRVCCPLWLCSMTPLPFWSDPFTLTGRDETLTYPSSLCLVNPGWLSPSCFNQDPFSPVCVFMNLSVCLSDCGWWDVEWRFLWPVAPYVVSLGTIHWIICHCWNILH